LGVTSTLRGRLFFCTQYLWQGQYPVQKKDRGDAQERTRRLFTSRCCLCLLLP